MMLRSAFLVAALAALAPAPAQVKITQGSDRILVDVDGKPFTAFFTGADLRKPYLHPLRTASGKIVTRRYPMEMVEGESRDHVHHRGLWFTHGNVNGLDFWANEPSQKGTKGKVVLKKITALESGRKSGRIAARFDWAAVDTDKTLLAEHRSMTFYSDPTLRTIDFDIVLTAIEEVVFGDTKEGTFAIRLAEPLNEKKGTGTMRTAEGAEKEAAVWGKRSPWVDYRGEIEGEKLGVAIFDHPTNPRHPTYWHSRGYGLFAANIFGVRDFTRDKSKDGSLKLSPGQTLRLRYRVLIHSGGTAEANLSALYKRYAAAK